MPRYSTVGLRDHDYTAEIFSRERRIVARGFSDDVRADWRSMIASILHDEEPTPTFATRGGRTALRYGGMLYQSPLRHYATCAECGAQACDCLCATDADGNLYVYTCDVCDQPSPSGEDCCEPEPEEEDDGYPRGSWRRIERRAVLPQGDPEPWAPYYVGIELETDSTPSRAEIDALDIDACIMGMWSDGTVRGPEIVTQPLRGKPLSRTLERLARLDVSLASAIDPQGQQCGMHIHVDARELTPAGARAMVRLWLAVQSALWADRDLHLREHSSYCHKLEPQHADYWIARTRSGRSDDDEGDDAGGEGSCPSRYKDVNFHAKGEHGTVEVRLWGWPSRANGWTWRERERFMWKCIRRTQALRLAAKLIGQSRLEAAHPALELDADDLLTMLESLVPLPPHVPGDK